MTERDQQRHWERTYADHPGMYGDGPSAPAVHFFGRELVDELAVGWDRLSVHAVEEGELPRRL